MDFNIISRREEELLDRQRIEFEIINTDKTMKISDVRIALAKKLDLKPETLVVRNIKTIYGKTSQKAIAFYYKTDKALKQLEHVSKLKKNGLISIQKQEKTGEEATKKEDNKVDKEAGEKEQNKNS